MAKTLKTLGRTLVAVLALGLMGSPAAQADTTTWITPEGNKGKFAAEQVSESFKVTYLGRSVTCETMMWEETFIGAGTKLLPFQPAFTGCKTTAELNATFTMHECDFIVKGAPGEVGYLGTTELSCPNKGEQLELHVYMGTVHKPENHVCTYTVKPQAALGNVSFENRALGSPKDDIWLNAEGVTFETTVHGSALICGANGSEARVFGSTTIRAFDSEGNQTKLTVGSET